MSTTNIESTENAVRRGAREVDAPAAAFPAAPGRTEMVHLRRGDLVFAVALVSLLLLSWFPRMHEPLDMRWDAGAYYVLGTSLAEGKGYRLLNEPGEIQMIQYPPGLPAIIAVHQRAVGTSDPHVVGPWLRATFLVITIAYALAAFALMRRFLPLSLAALGTLLCVVTPASGNSLMAEVPFVMLVTLFAVFALRADRASRWLAGLCAVLAFLTRTAGIAVLLAWVAESAVKRQWRSAGLRLLVAALPVLAWQGYVQRVQASAAFTEPAYEYQRAPYLFNNVTYAANLQLRSPFVPELGTATPPEMVWRSVSKLPHLPNALGEVVSLNRQSWETVLSWAGMRSLVGRRATELAARSVLVVLGLLALGGIVVMLRRRHYLLTFVLGATILAVCATPWSGHWARYLKPVTPLIVLAAIFGGLALYGAARRALQARRGAVEREELGERTGHRAVALAAAALLLVNVAAIVQTQRSNYHRVEYEGRNGEPVSYRLYHYRDSYRSFDAGLDWLRHRARPSDVVATTMPYWTYLRTGMQAVMPPAEAEPDEVLRLLDGVPARYVIAGGSTAVVWADRHVYPAVAGAPDRWTPIYRSPDESLVIYERQMLGSAAEVNP